MEIIRHRTAADFLQVAAAWLEQAEAENNLILGIAGYIKTTDEESDVTAFTITVEESGTIIGAALMTPPQNLIISRMPNSALGGLVDYFVTESMTLPGVVGPKDKARIFAEYWQHETQKRPRIKMNQRLYACERVIVPAYSRGRLRPAVQTEEGLLIDWAVGFCCDAGIEDEIEQTKARIPSAIARRSLYIWDDEQAVSMAIAQRETTSGICVSMVYTPPHLRKQGYASSCVAALTQQLLDSGRKFCCLYTDLSNPTSNSIYQKIGYEPVCDSECLVFE